VPEPQSCQCTPYESIDQLVNCYHRRAGDRESDRGSTRQMKIHPQHDAQEDHPEAPQDDEHWVAEPDGEAGWGWTCFSRHYLSPEKDEGHSPAIEPRPQIVNGPALGGRDGEKDDVQPFPGFRRRGLGHPDATF